jgi:hypothetical protein
MPAEAETLAQLAHSIEKAPGDEKPLAKEIARALQPYLESWGAEEHKMKGRDLLSTDYVLHMIALAAPGWAILLKGKAAPGGHWTASLRPSEARDEAEVIGHAAGPDLSNTLLASLLRVLAYRAKQSA